MESTRTAVRATVLIILVTVAVSGPFVPQIDLTSYPDAAYCEASGDATVSVERAPVDDFTIEQIDKNPERYKLTGPPFRVETTAVRGCPVLVYRVGIPDLGFTSVRRAFLSPEGNSTVTMSLVSGEFDGARITNETYPATVELQILGNESRTVYSRNVSIPVSR